jgi:hypothetical protein
MPRERKRARRYVWLVWLALLIPLILFLLSFLGDISQVFSYIWQFLTWALFGRNQALPLPTPATVRSLQVLFYTVIIGFFGTFFTWLLLMSFQALLPVETLDEVFETASHTITYILGEHGPAMFVLNGKMDHSAGELDRPGPGVIVVNFNSALVLETMLGRSGCLMMPFVLLHRFIRWITNAKPEPVTRVAGPGIVFSAPNERIRAVVDLRKQSRAAKSRISAYTRDGIEISSAVFAVFTIGQRPDIIELAYQGDRRIENLRVISTRRVGRNLVEVKTLNHDELDPADLAEAHDYARIPNQRRDAQRYTPVSFARPEPEFNEQRVFKAVYAQARNPQEQVVPWTELPAQVSADVYRRLMSRINYDELYQLHDPNPTSFPIPEIKRHFRNQVRNTGLLMFRVVFHRSLIPLADGTYNESDLFVSPSLPFTGPQVLRDRGIKVIFAGFSSPMAAPEIYQQRLTSWRAEWEHATELKRSQKELEATRIRNHARAQSQRELTRSLAEIFQQGVGNDEVMALRVLQALEGAASDPKTRQLLPGETITLLNNLHNWLLPGDASRAGAVGLIMPNPLNPALPPEQPNGLPPDFLPPDNVQPPPPIEPDTSLPSDE